MTLDRRPTLQPIAECELDEEVATWFEQITGVQILLDRPRLCCVQWIAHGQTCTWRHSCRERDQGSVFDHPVQAIDATGNRCVLVAPYQFRSGIEVAELERWCARRSMTWEILPIAYWAPATTTVLVRHVDAPDRSWHHFVGSSLGVDL